MAFKRQRHDNSTGSPTQLLWGGAFIILLLLGAQALYFYFNTQSHYRAQLNVLREELIDEQHSRLASELADARAMIDQRFIEAMALLKQQARSQTHQALTQMNSLYQRYHEQLSDAEMQQMLIESLRDIRFFDGRGYYFIDEMDGTIRLLPTNSEKEGSSALSMQDTAAQRVMQGLIRVVSNPRQEGFSYYRWYAPDDKQVMKEKVSYVGVFKPYNWIVGTGDYLYRFENDLKPKIYDDIRHIHFARTGYIALMNRQGRLLASGANPEREGIDYLHHSDPAIRATTQQIIEQAQLGGYLSYDDYQADKHPLIKSQLIEDRDWVLMAGIYQNEINELFSSKQQRLDAEIKRDRLHQMIALSVIGLLALLITLTYSRWLKARFTRYEHDINRQQHKLRKVADTLKLNALIVESAYEGVIVCDADLRIVQVNSAFTRITGYPSAEVLGKTPAILSSGFHDDQFYQEMWHALNVEGSWRGEVWSKRKSGEVYPEWLSISENKYADGSVQNYIATFSDITQLKDLEHKLRDLAETDPLTGLANRRMLMDCLNRDLAARHRYQSAGIALFYIDLDHFKTINDCYGHDIGDSLLIEVAKRLQSCLRDSDLPCRVGGDEFILIVKFKEDIGVEELIQFSQRLLNALIKPMHLTNIDIEISCSVGVAVCESSDDAYSLMKSADQALYKAKHQGRGCACFHDDRISATVYPSPAEVESP
ncbi:cache domain-containing protein [Amphritea sp. 1_MG-2023]|uniref:sensor domain-containing diguanylate cyclase n=1 Tax=Amphritea sp. 1_MG-2023 TaxID=3062670 RepID=UPI0026E309DB|nr:cache domain-containing protein [Amphritea sp. 1_MG-2023]MDO6564575.1 cache domain-containing protein [Amphritea sp. 1_MG-2023]